MGELLPGTPVELKVPAREEFIGVAKRVATSLGGQHGFSLDETEELAIAVVQSFGNLIDAATERWGDGATVKVTFTATESGITADFEALAPGSEGALFVPRRPQVAERRAEAHAEQEAEARREVAQALIRMFVDDFRAQAETGRRLMRYRMVKYRVS